MNKETPIFFIRHSKSGYKTYRAAEESKNPQQPFNSEDQITPDLNQEGVLLANKKAEEMLRQLDPKVHTLFFVSSNEARAIETANIYRKTAKDMGFEIINPGYTNSKLAKEVGEGEIRVLDSLSLNPNNILLFNIFLPESQLKNINWETIDQDVKKKWEKARTIIRADDKGSYGKNLLYHSAEIQKIFPEVSSIEDFGKQFKKLARLAKRAIKRFKLQTNNVKVLAFGHENYMLQALSEYLQSDDIQNCETIEVDLDTENIRMTSKGKVVNILDRS